jgi:ankyrin repeat protein
MISKFKEELSKELISKACVGLIEKCKELIKLGADVNYIDRANHSAITAAVVSGKKELIDLMLEHGANINQRADNKTGLVLLATINSNSSMVAHLLEKGADPNMQDEDGDTALHYCAAWGNESIAVSVLDHGGNPFIKNKGSGRTRINNDPCSAMDIATYFRSESLISLFKKSTKERIKEKFRKIHPEEEINI